MLKSFFTKKNNFDILKYLLLWTHLYFKEGGCQRTWAAGIIKTRRLKELPMDSSFIKMCYVYKYFYK